MYSGFFPPILYAIAAENFTSKYAINIQYITPNWFTQLSLKEKIQKTKMDSIVSLLFHYQYPMCMVSICMCVFLYACVWFLYACVCLCASKFWPVNCIPPTWKTNIFCTVGVLAINYFNFVWKYSFLLYFWRIFHWVQLAGFFFFSINTQRYHTISFLVFW